MTTVEWNYTVTPDRGRWLCRQAMNGRPMKHTWADTEEEGRALCKAWAAATAP